MTHRARTLGVVGGLGLETGQRFCTNVASKVRKATGVQPSIVCHIVNMPAALESDLIYGRASEEHFSILDDSIRALGLAGADRIAVPCNTVHVFMGRMRKASRVPIMSIIEETAKAIAAMDFKAVGILASSTTINSGLYQKELSKHGIRAMVPTCEDQGAISGLISDILNGNPIRNSAAGSMQVIKKLEKGGAEAIVLGCTDLRLADLRPKTPVIDSTAALEDAAIRYLTGGGRLTSARAAP